MYDDYLDGVIPTQHGLIRGQVVSGLSSLGATMINIERLKFGHEASGFMAETPVF